MPQLVRVCLRALPAKSEFDVCIDFLGILCYDDKVIRCFCLSVPAESYIFPHLFTNQRLYLYMNSQELDILNALLSGAYVSQRQLSADTGHSLGTVNNALKVLTERGYLTSDKLPTQQACALQEQNAPKNAVILAAGFGMRMVPINLETPKALLEVHGEILIERTIRQLHQAGIRDIRVVVGFMKEQFEYLIDSFGVELVVNPEYAAKNNLHSLKKVLPRLGGTYVIPSDIWCRENPYRSRELYSWYAVTDATDPDSTVRINRKRELVASENGGNAMLGIAYLTPTDSIKLTEKLKTLCSDSRYDGSFWEDALFDCGICVQARVLPAQDAVEINTYEQLRNLDRDSGHLHSGAIEVICNALGVDSQQITDITVLKKGMTNRSFLFRCKDKKYIMRIPGEGTDKLINRAEEAAVYSAIDGKRICDDIAYMNPENGYKITRFLENARVCDPEDPRDVKACMARLRQFHQQKLQVEHTFDIFGQIEFYESLWAGAPSCYRDYEKTKQQVLTLKAYIDKQEKDWCLTHIDAVPDNFLFADDEIRLIDWEYAGMQDPHVDIAMFCIYSLYGSEQTEALIDAYFPEGCPPATRIKIYCYIAACGLLWSNWCEYKRQLGVEFGEYSLRQYRYAKDYYRIAIREMERIDA